MGQYLENSSDFLGAVASNAGDDFHILWAARQMLKLLDMDDDVSGVKVEGPPRDEMHSDIGEHGQAVDVTLLRNSADGTSYTYLQLKHSASDPKNSWNWSRLLTPRAKTKPLSSVLGKLAQLLKAVGFKGNYSIVTNQPLSHVVAEDIRRLIKNGRKPVPDDAELLKKLTEGLGLTATQVIKFLEAWDLTGFSSASRLSMESEVIQRIARLSDADARDDANLLLKRVATLMLPESCNDTAVTREQLLVWLGIGSKGMLFPAPSHIKPAQPYLRRAICRRLGESLARSLKPMRIHAGGGCGKTSLIYDLPSMLPAGSEVFIYDCYGGGLFLASDQKRHLPETAFTQIGNELAIRLKTPLVMRRQGSIDVFEALRNRIALAAELLKLRNPDALLVLCFDAADNAKTGAQHWHEPCFLDTLCQASAWPDNVRVVVSCRTARLANLGEKHLFEDFEISPFDVDEVRELVALWQPEWRKELATTFENLTGGNPRRLVYAIKGLPSDGEKQAIERLMPKAEGINPLFEQRVLEAGTHLGDTNKVWRVLDALSRLPRPVPGHMLAILAELTPPDIIDIAADVGGIIEREEGWSFHDEDFEAFVIERVESDGKAVLDHAAELLLSTKLTDRYSATSIAEVLVAANRFEDLYKLVTDEKETSKVLTPLEAQFVQSRNLSLAIRCCRTLSDITSACSLLITSADAIRRTKLLEAMTVDNLDLSVRFAADEANRLVMVGQRHRAKRARLRIELARQLSQQNPEAAKLHLRWWHAHLRELHETDSPNKFKVTDTDIAAEYQSYATLHGHEIAFKRLLNWRPKSALLSVFRLLATSAAGCNRKVLLETIGSRDWPPLGLAPLMAAALLAGADINEPVMLNGLTRLARAKRTRWSTSIESSLINSPVLAWHESVLLVCERSIIHEDLRTLVAQILDHALPKPELSETHHLYRLRSGAARHARVYVMRELISGSIISVEDWLPLPLKVPQRTNSRSTRQHEESPEEYWNKSLTETVLTFSKFVKAARVTLSSIAVNPLQSWSELANVLSVSNVYNQPFLRDSDQAVLLIRNHLMHTGITGGDVISMIPSVHNVLESWSSDNITNMLELSKALVLQPSAHDAALTLLSELVDRLTTSPLPASERLKLFVKGARIALPLDMDFAKLLFGKAAEATSTIDYDAHSALQAVGVLMKAGVGDNWTVRAAFAARLADAVGAVVESLDLGRDFDWGEAEGWVTACNLPMGLVTAARWHDRGISAIDQTLHNVIANGRELSLPQRVALATVATDGPIELRTAIDGCSKHPKWMVESTLAAQLNSGDPEAFSSLFHILQEVGAPDAQAAILAAKTFNDTFVEWQKSIEDASKRFDKKLEDKLELKPELPLATPDDIRAALQVGAGKYEPSAYQFCDVAKRVNSFKLRVPFLEIALEIGGQHGEFGEAIPQILEHWSNYPPVVTWMRERFPSYIVGALSHLFQWRYDKTDIIEAALAATGLTLVEQASLLLEGIERQEGRISADLLYTLIGLIAARTPIEKRSSLLDALLLRVETRTTHQSLVCLTDIMPPEDNAESVARFLFSAMGDMDRRVRWRASHAALILMRGQDPAWDKLVKCLTQTEEPVFVGDHFYHYAAREQLCLVMLRATTENPKSVAPYASLILDTINREPHLIIRELGRSVLKALESSKDWLPTAEERSFVDQINRSQLSPVARSQQNWRLLDSEISTQRKYHFDSIDAVPYWFKSVTRLFDISMDDFLSRLEYILCDQWGCDATITNWDKEPRLERLNGTHDLTSRRHGARPTIERLSYYLEWQAMMCAVGELIGEQPLVVSSDDNKCAFRDWLERSLVTLSPHWLSDFRTFAPLESRFWGIPPVDIPETDSSVDDDALAHAWSQTLSPSDFDAEINAAEGIVVAADFRLRWDSAEQDVYVHSALVSSSTANALAQALANVRNRMDFALPDGRYHQDIDSEEFKLEAWLQTNEQDPKLDKFDVRRGTVTGIPVEPFGAAFAEELTFDVEQASWQSPHYGEILKIAQWGSEDTVNGSGWRATVNRGVLPELLKAADRSLILQVEISRQLRNGKFDADRTKWLIYVVNANGDVARIEREKRSLGKNLVRREGLHNSVDTLGRWMLHRIAELERQRSEVGRELNDILELEIHKIYSDFQQRNEIF